MILIYDGLITNHIDFQKTSTTRLWSVYIARIANFKMFWLKKLRSMLKLTSVMSSLTCQWLVATDFGINL